MKRSTRSERDVFADLAGLAVSPGYVHAVAFICRRDNLIAYSNEMRPDDMARLFSRDRLIRTEISTILGLMVRQPVDFSLPDPATIKRYVARTDTLMSELHEAMNAPMRDSMLRAFEAGKADESIWTGKALREPIFYGGESAYTFQYRELAAEKYSNDDDWLTRTRGFHIRSAKTIAAAMCSLMDERATRFHADAKASASQPRTWLPVFEFSADELEFRARVPLKEVIAFLDAFTLSGNNPQFNSLGDFNAMNAAPLIRSPEGRVLLFQQYSIYESLYESPFYWMLGDEAYRDTAAANRGAFTEAFTRKRLASVFGKSRVHQNVHLNEAKGRRIGEVDVLVVFGDRLVIVQTKSKKLTLESRRGNDGALRRDFAAAIQDSYDQALLCAQAIANDTCKLVTDQGIAIDITHRPREIYIFNVVAEHYPALSFQARQFLKYQVTPPVLAPFVMDVFLLDALTEMLETPLRLLSYVSMRVQSIDRVVLSHELTALGFHLKRNLWIEPEYNMAMLDDTIAADLDLAMTVRREGVPGQRTPEGILTRLAGTLYEHLIFQIERSPEPGSVQLGMVLLTLNEGTCWNVHNGLKTITRETARDGKTHDFTIAGDYGGITFHCSLSPNEDSVARLGIYCERRKYVQRARQWFGVAINVRANLFAGLALEYDWVQSDVMDQDTADMKKAMPVPEFVELMKRGAREKTGRNDPCPCGSGLKFKKCCLGKPTGWRRS